MTGNSKPTKNHSRGLRPNRLARRAVMIGILNRNKIPRLIKRTAPITANKYKLKEKSVRINVRFF